MKKLINDLITTLDTYLAKKAPALPLNIKDLIVKLAPWLVLLSVIMSIPAILAIFGFGALSFGNPYRSMMLPSYGVTYILSIVVLAITTVLSALAIKGLMNKTKSGWMLLFYSTLVSVVYSILSFNIIGGLLSALISFYLLFQVREYYK